MIDGVDSGLGTPERYQASALAGCHSSVSLLPVFFRFFLEGNANLIIALKPSPHSPGLGMSFSSLPLSDDAMTSAGWLPSSSKPFLLFVTK